MEKNAFFCGMDVLGVVFSRIFPNLMHAMLPSSFRNLYWLNQPCFLLTIWGDEALKLHNMCGNIHPCLRQRKVQNQGTCGVPDGWRGCQCLQI